MSWLTDLKVGDKIIYCESAPSSREGLETVARLTPSRIFTKHQSFRKEDGYRVGRDRWSSCRIEEWSPEKENKIIRRLRRRARIRLLSRFDFFSLSDDQLVRVTDIIKEQ